MIDRELAAVIIVDHGSRRKESNDRLLMLVDLYREKHLGTIVEPAHMELAEPSISESFARCVEQGATQIIVSPFFLFPGRHWSQDIPNLVAEAASSFPEVKYLVTAPLDLHPLLLDVIDHRIESCLEKAKGNVNDCDICSGNCAIRSADSV